MTNLDDAELIHLRQRVRELEERLDATERAWLVGAPHGDTADCPTFHDGCHCTVETLAYNIQRAERAEAEERG